MGGKDLMLESGKRNSVWDEMQYRHPKHMAQCLILKSVGHLGFQHVHGRMLDLEWQRN